MINRTQIRKYARQIGQEFHPERILLFGSYARGKPTEDSDVDLLVIMDHDKPRNLDQVIDMRLKMDASFPMDLLVRRPSEISDHLTMNDSFIKGILQDGEVLYEQAGHAVD